MIVTGVEGEMHQLGANMLADVLEAEGWDVRFLGTQLPHRDILQAIEEHEPTIVGISATMLFNVPKVSSLIGDVRLRYGSDVRIILGGAAFGSQEISGAISERTASARTCTRGSRWSIVSRPR